MGLKESVSSLVTDCPRRQPEWQGQSATFFGGQPRCESSSQSMLTSAQTSAPMARHVRCPGWLLGWLLGWLVFNSEPDRAGDALSEKDAHVLQDCCDQLCAMEHIDSMTSPNCPPKPLLTQRLFSSFQCEEKSITINGSP